MDSKPYVGVTGLASIGEVKKVTREFEDAGFDRNSSHVPMIGFLVSSQTLQGRQTSNRRYPEISLVPKLLQESGEGVFRTIHYTTRDQETLYDQVEQLLDGPYEERLCQGLQLNMTFPPVPQIGKIKRRFPQLEIIFAANKGVISSGFPNHVAQRMGVYQGAIDYVLIDPSGGRGEELKVEKSVRVAKEIRKKGPRAMLGFAGGLTGENVYDTCFSLRQNLGGDSFCIDAEGGLRNKLSDEWGDDILDIRKVRVYLQEAARVF